MRNVISSIKLGIRRQPIVFTLQFIGSVILCLGLGWFAIPAAAIIVAATAYCVGNL